MNKDYQWEIEQIEDAIIYYKEALDSHQKSDVFKEKIKILYEQLSSLRKNYVNTRVSEMDNVYNE